MRSSSFCVFAVLLVTSCTAWAQEVSDLYTSSELNAIGARYRPRLRGLWEEDFLSRLTGDERVIVRLNIPVIGENGYILDFQSYPELRQVSLPVASIKFIDDMAVAFAFYDKSGCDIGAVSDYAAVLRFRSGVLKGSPLDALGVPRSAIKDSYVDDVAQKILKSIVFFLAAHEYAHVMYGHKEAYGAASQRQEIEADAFALNIMRRIGVPPIGVFYFFLIASRLEDAPGDFASFEEYELGRHKSSHPVAALRIIKIAEVIQSNIPEFSRLQRDKLTWERKLQDHVRQLREIAGSLDDQGMRMFLKARAKEIDVTELKGACRP